MPGLGGRTQAKVASASHRLVPANHAVTRRAYASASYYRPPFVRVFAASTRHHTQRVAHTGRFAMGSQRRCSLSPLRNPRCVPAAVGSHHAALRFTSARLWLRRSPPPAGKSLIGPAGVSLTFVCHSREETKACCRAAVGRLAGHSLQRLNSSRSNSRPLNPFHHASPLHTISF